MVAADPPLPNILRNHLDTMASAQPLVAAPGGTRPYDEAAVQGGLHSEHNGQALIRYPSDSDSQTGLLLPGQQRGRAADQPGTLGQDILSTHLAVAR